MNNLLKVCSIYIFELKRRKTIRTAIGYLLILTALVGPASDILGGLGAPDWILRIFIYLLLGIFPFVLITSWFFDVTAKGLEWTENLSDQKETQKPAPLRQRTSVWELSEGNESALRNLASDVSSFSPDPITKLKCTLVVVKRADKEEEVFLIPESDVSASSNLHLGSEFSEIDGLKQAH